jgi:trigger factor
LTPEGEEAVDISGGEATDFQLELEEGRFLADIVQGIVGMTPGETKEIPVTFPEDYPREDLASQSAVFTLTLKELKEKELPELDDDFAQDISEEETIGELRESLAKQFAEKAEQETKTNKENALIEALVAQVEIDLPDTLIEREVQTILTQTAIQMESYGMDLQKVFTAEMMPQLRERTRPDAIARLRQSLALEELAKRESLTVDDQQMDAKSQEVMKQLAGQDVDPVRLREFVKSDLLKEKAIQWLEEHATIELVPEGSLETEETTETPETVSEASEDVAVQPEATADQETDESSPTPDASEQTAASE